MESLQKSVQTVIESGRIGSPVFLRCVCQIATGSSLLQPAAAVMALANGWMPAEPEGIYAQGDADATQVTLMVKYVGGQSAVLSVNRTQTGTECDVMLVGNKGVIYHETPTGRHAISATPLEMGDVRELTPVIAQALESGQPIQVEG